VKGAGVNTKTVKAEYDRLVDQFGSEFAVLMEVDEKRLEAVGGKRLAEAVGKVRRGEIVVEPGYDGVFGTVKIWPEKNEQEAMSNEQMGLF
jgi:DNA helicase-2/ATP-dependent DNA helicase PcrA